MRRRKRNPFGITSAEGLEVAQSIFGPKRRNPELDDLEDEDDDLEDDLDDDDDLEDDLDDEEDLEEDDDGLGDLEDDDLEDDDIDDDDDGGGFGDLDDEEDAEEVGGIASYYRNPWRYNPEEELSDDLEEDEEDDLVSSRYFRNPWGGGSSDDKIEDELESFTNEIAGSRYRGRKNPLRRRRNVDDLITDGSGKLSLGLRRRRNVDDLVTDGSGKLSLGLRRRRNSGADLAWGGSLYQPRWNSVRHGRRRNPLAKTSRWTHPTERKTMRWAPPVCEDCGQTGCDGFCATPYRSRLGRRSNPLYRRRLRRHNPWTGGYRRNG